MKFLCCFIILIHLSLATTAQFVYQLVQDLPVSQGKNVLGLPWAGGLNAAQYNTIDINGDGLEDLVVFDRTGNKIYPFLNKNNIYEYSPDYAFHFPDDIRSWMLLRDFNCDGKKDIFTSHAFGTTVYVNETIPGEALTWRQYVSGKDHSGNEQHFIKTKGFTSIINMQMNASDIPAIVDIDGDTDLDILVFRASGASTVEFHKNLSIEQEGNCNLLQYERITQSWGGFQECECGTFAFSGRACETSHGREQHQGGKALLLLDMDNDGDQDVIISEESCPHLFYMENEGDVTQEVINSATMEFPNSTDPVDMPYFPAAYFEDVDHDGVKDLIVSPNLSHNVANAVNFQSSGWLYKNSGTEYSPSFNLNQQNFLQDQMIDLGENTAPAFFDYDNDGDKDLVVGSYLNHDISENRSTLQLYKNTGTADNPSFQLVDSDYNGLSSKNLFNLKPKFKDINGDNRVDLVFSATKSDNTLTSIYYLLNKGAEGFSSNPYTLFSDIKSDDNFEVADINYDGLPDLLLGQGTGRIAYYKNAGTDGSPIFILEDETFYDFDLKNSMPNIAIAVSDINADGDPDMIVADQAGGITVYASFLDHLDNPQDGVIGLIVPLSDKGAEPQEFNLGSSLTPVVANLFNEHMPTLVIGTGQGGIHVLKNIDARPDGGSKDFTVDIFPNPVFKSTDRSLTIKAEVGGRASIMSVLGQRVTKDFILEPNIQAVIPIDQLQPGLYIVAIAGKKGTITRKFIIAE